VVPVVTPPIIPPSLPVVPPLPPPSVPTGTTFLTPVTVHSNGVYIETLQAFLNATVPHTNLVVDGTFGHLTIIAIKTFQALHGLTADGIMGKKTREVMNTVAGK
jgi:peptidoglycan hydrolase-like protein with peptidoglycan-binding domain